MFIVFSDACQDNYIALKLFLKAEDEAQYGGFGNKSVVVPAPLSSRALASIKTNANAQVCGPPAFFGFWSPVPETAIVELMNFSCLRSKTDSCEAYVQVFISGMGWPVRSSKHCACM